MNASGVSLMPLPAPHSLELVARVFELGDVRLVDLRDVRHVDPARLQPRTGNLLDAPERLDFDRAELREVDLRHLRQRAADRRAGARAPPPSAPA